MAKPKAKKMTYNEYVKKYGTNFYRNQESQKDAKTYGELIAIDVLKEVTASLKTGCSKTS